MCNTQWISNDLSTDALRTNALWPSTGRKEFLRVWQWMPLADTLARPTVQSNKFLHDDSKIFIGGGKVSSFPFVVASHKPTFPLSLQNSVFFSYNWTAFPSQSLYSASLLADHVHFSSWVRVVPTLGKNCEPDS